MADRVDALPRMGAYLASVRTRARPRRLRKRMAGRRSAPHAGERTAPDRHRRIADGSRGGRDDAAAVDFRYCP